MSRLQRMFDSLSSPGTGARTSKIHCCNRTDSHRWGHHIWGRLVQCSRPPASKSCKRLGRCRRLGVVGPCGKSRFDRPEVAGMRLHQVGLRRTGGCRLCWRRPTGGARQELKARCGGEACVSYAPEIVQAGVRAKVLGVPRTAAMMDGDWGPSKSDGRVRCPSRNGFRRAARRLFRSCLRGVEVVACASAWTDCFRRAGWTARRRSDGTFWCDFRLLLSSCFAPGTMSDSPTAPFTTRLMAMTCWARSVMPPAFPSLSCSAFVESAKRSRNRSSSRSPTSRMATGFRCRGRTSSAWRRCDRRSAVARSQKQRPVTGGRLACCGRGGPDGAGRREAALARDRAVCAAPGRGRAGARDRQGELSAAAKMVRDSAVIGTSG